MLVSLGDHNYTVTFDAIKDPLKESLPKEDYRLYIKLHKQVKTDPDSTLPPLLKLHEKHPNVPAITNLLTYIYFQKKEIDKGEALIEENYKNNPTDLFARINYADQCLRKKKAKEVPAIFDHTFDLFKLMPDRTLFHYSEISGFAICMSFYYYSIGKRDVAHDFYRAAVQVDPHAPGLTALEKRLFKKSWFPTLRRFARSCKILVQSKKSQIDK